MFAGTKLVKKQVARKTDQPFSVRRALKGLVSLFTKEVPIVAKVNEAGDDGEDSCHKRKPVGKRPQAPGDRPPKDVLAAQRVGRHAAPLFKKRIGDQDDEDGDDSD